MFPPDLLPVPIFNALPGAYLLLTPEFVIAAASDDYLVATLTTREQVVGRLIFDAFPDNPDAPEAQATQNLRASLEHVLATGQLHQMALQHYDVPDPIRPGHFVERHWLCTNRPVRDADGQITHLLHAAIDVTAQQQADRLLRNSQADEQAARADAAQQRTEFRQFMEQAPMAVAVYHGPDFRVELANAATLAIWGRPLEAVLGRPVFEALPEAATPEVVALFEHVFHSGIPHTVHEQATTLHRHGRSEVVYWSFLSLPQRGPDGSIKGLITVGTDVTEQVRARQQVEELNQKLESRVQARTQEALALQADLLAAAQQQAEGRALMIQVFEQTPACIALLRGPEHRFEYVNRAYQDLFPGRELVGHALAEALPDAADQGFVALLDGVYRTGETFFGNELPLAIAQPDGHPPRQAYFTFTYQVYREHGQVVGISIFAFDVAEQVRARQERAAQQRQLQEVFEQAPVAIFVVRGEEYVFEVVNPSMGRMLGSTPDQILGQRYFDLLPALADQGYCELLAQVWHSGQEYVAHEQAAQLPHHRDGEPGYYNFSYVPLRNAEGSTTSIMCVAVDVTPQVRARQQVQELNQALQATNEELGDSNQQLVRTNVDLDNFIYTASHDLKAPISNIEGLLGTLRDELPPQEAGGEVPHILNLMQDSVNRFTRTIEHLTDVSRLQKEHNQSHEPVSLPDIIEDVRLDLAPLLQQTGGQLAVDVRAVPTMQFSLKNLRSVVYNLLSNALKYRHPDRAPLVQVRARAEGAYHVLEVQDNGLGLDLTREQELFGLFRRYHTHVPGSGIGLYMVKRIVENTGGRIEVHSTLGEGSTFTVYIPQP